MGYKPKDKKTSLYYGLEDYIADYILREARTLDDITPELIADAIKSYEDNNLGFVNIQ